MIVSSMSLKRILSHTSSTIIGWRTISDLLLQQTTICSRIRSKQYFKMSSRAFNIETNKELAKTRYESAILHLNSLQSNAMTLQKMKENREEKKFHNVADTRRFLEICDIQLSDVDKLNPVHVSGTKGKGSTCAFLESIFRSLGLKTGVYTSPHLVHVRERIRINGISISEDKFAQYFFDVYYKCKEKVSNNDEMPPYFKFLTLMALDIFVREKVDVAIVEVGIGGHFDCTNVLQHPTVCAMTTLDIDHTSMLGSTIEEIAWHKAGIFKKDTPAVVTEPSATAMEVVVARAAEKLNPLFKAPSFDSYQWPREVHAGIAGDHQKTNVALALQIARIWLEAKGFTEMFNEDNWNPGEGYVVPEKFVEAIEHCRWPGRSQIIEKGTVTFFLDGAHTPKSVQSCSRWFANELSLRHDAAKPRRRRVLIFQCTADRNPDTLLDLLKEHDFDDAIFCPLSIFGALDKKSDLTNFNANPQRQLENCVRCQQVWTKIYSPNSLVVDSISAAVDWVTETSAESGPLDVFVTGSFHLVGGVLSRIQPDLE